MPRFMRAGVICSLLAAGLWLYGVPSAIAMVPGSSCRSAGVEFWKAGTRQMEHYEDEHGHDVEVWCTRGVFIAHYDLRVGWEERDDSHAPASGEQPSAIHRSLVVAGCFFNFGTNSGPDISRDPSGAYSKVEWTNVAHDDDKETYHFSYDFHTNLVTISAALRCSAPVIKVVAPQASFRELNDLLPDPPVKSCPLKVQ